MKHQEDKRIFIFMTTFLSIHLFIFFTIMTLIVIQVIKQNSFRQDRCDES